VNELGDQKESSEEECVGGKFEMGETTLGEDTKDPTTHWNSERIGRED